MTEQPPPEPTGLKIGDLKKLIHDTVSEVMKGVSPTDKPETVKDHAPEGIADKVRAEIEKIKAREKEEKDKNDLKAQVKALAEGKQEKPPVERRRVHKFMGWGENAD